MRTAWARTIGHELAAPDGRADPARADMERGSSSSKSRHLSVVTTTTDTKTQELTRAQVADRLGASVSTVRRYEGVRLHPQVDEDGVHWFDPKEVSALAAERANEHGPRRRNANVASRPADERAPGEIAALVFERLKQRQSLAEIVVALRIEPQLVRALFDQWTLGLTEGQLRMKGEPAVPREHETSRATPATLAARLAELPESQSGASGPRSIRRGDRQDRSKTTICSYRSMRETAQQDNATSNPRFDDAGSMVTLASGCHPNDLA